MLLSLIGFICVLAAGLFLSFWAFVGVYIFLLTNCNLFGRFGFVALVVLVISGPILIGSAFVHAPFTITLGN